MAKTLEDELKTLLGIADPVRRFRYLQRLTKRTGLFQERVIALKAEALREIKASDPDLTWDQVGAMFGISGSRAHKLAS